MKILLVDDDKTIITIAALSLKKKGSHEVVCASTAAHGLALAEELRPDLILLDIGLPDLNGIEFCGKIKNNPKTAPIPVIFLSAQTDPEELDRANRAGAAGHIKKPFNPLSLPDEVRRVLDQAAGG